MLLGWSHVSQLFIPEDRDCGFSQDSIQEMKCHAERTKWPYSVQVDAPSPLFIYRFVHLFSIKYTHAFYYMQKISTYMTDSMWRMNIY